MGKSVRRENKTKRRERESKDSRNAPLGLPAVLLTCERGRELKCEREGMDVLLHYVERISINSTKKGQDSRGSSAIEAGRGQGQTSRFTGGLEKELIQLRQQNERLRNTKQQHSPYAQALSVYDTGCGGTVLVICSSPNSRIIPQKCKGRSVDPDVEDTAKGDETSEKRPRDEGVDAAKSPQESSTIELAANGSPDTETDEQTEDVRSFKRPKISLGDVNATNTEQTGSTDDSITNLEGWDPVVTVESILQESAPNFLNPDVIPPSSRFVTRVIPLQATCASSLAEIQDTTEALLLRFLQGDKRSAPLLEEVKKSGSTTTPTTFGIFVKRRNCSHLSSQKIIEVLAEKVLSPMAPASWKVNLRDPEVKIWVEICRNIAGVSVFRVSPSSILRIGGGSNFNLAEVRASTKS
ncbi:hypothetical protein ACA910_019685 [Epithemia clementina (nom. ined.)]